MKIKMKTTASGPSGVFVEGTIVSIPEEMSHEEAENLIPIYAEIVGGEIVERAIAAPYETRKAGRPRKA